MVSRGSARTTSTPWTPGIPLSRAVSGAAGAAGPGPAVPARIPGLLLPATWFDADTWSVSTFASAALPNRVRSLAFCVVIATTATVVMNRASTRPLTARKAALGSSARRRAAISVPGRLVHRAMTLAAAMVSHGPAMNRPTMMSAKLDTNAWTCPPVEAGWPCTAQKPSSARPASSGTTRQARGGFGVARRATPSGEMFTRRSASRAATAAKTGTPIATARMSSRLSDSSAGKNGWPMNGMPATGMRSRKKIPNPAATPRIRGHGRFGGGEQGDLPAGRADQAHRREPFLAAGGRQPGRGGDEDQHRGQDGQRDDGQDEVDGARPASRVGRGVGQALGAGLRPGDGPAQLRCGDRRHLHAVRGVRQLRRGAPDDDDQRARRRQRGVADHPGQVAGVAAGELVRRGGCAAARRARARRSTGPVPGHGGCPAAPATRRRWRPRRTG